MQHKFNSQNMQELQGTWFKDNGRRFCAWRYDSAERILKSSRGVVVHSKHLDLSSESSESLREELPKLALELACEDVRKDPTLH